MELYALISNMTKHELIIDTNDKNRVLTHCTCGVNFFYYAKGEKLTNIGEGLIYINESFNKHVKEATAKEENDERFKILCPYCNAIWNGDMIESLSFAEGSYTPDCVSSRILGMIDIHCHNCKKLIYRKEISKSLDEYDEKRWKD